MIFIVEYLLCFLNRSQDDVTTFAQRLSDKPYDKRHMMLKIFLIWLQKYGSRGGPIFFRPLFIL